MGLSGRESEGSSGQEIGWSGSFFYTAENTHENKDMACIFRREGTSPGTIGPPISGVYLISGSEKPGCGCAGLQTGAQATPKARQSRGRELSAAVQDVATEMKSLLRRDRNRT